MKALHIVAIVVLTAFSVGDAMGQVSLIKKDVRCKGEKTGKVTVASIANATYPIRNYAWSNGKSGTVEKTIFDVGAGTYTVTVTDANDCTATASITVEEPECKLGLDINTTADEFFVCGTSSIIVSATPTCGKPPYTTNGSSGAYATRVSLASFGDGPRYLDFQTTDANGCTAKKRQFFAFSAVSCASDPNDITGPEGIDEDRWVAAKNQMEYRIRFENDPNVATAPAQRVEVFLPVDPKINPFSLRLGSFGWGSFEFDVPENSTFYQTRLDLTDSLGLFIDVTAGYDVNEGRYFWLFESIDPATLQPPIDPLLGFLPVNDTLTGSGEGFIDFRMKPVSTAMTGDTVLAQAEIIFDVNESIFTNTWKNKLDAVAPVSTLHELPDTLENPDITISWSAADDIGGVGIGEYELLVAVDDQPMVVVQTGITDTSIVFTGASGSAHQFMILAMDKVGNKESLKPLAEDTVYLLPVRQITIDEPMDHDLCVYDSLTIRWSKSTTDSVTVELTLDSMNTWTTLALASTLDSVTIYLHDTMVTNEAFLRFSDVQDSAVQTISQVLSIHERPEVDAGDSTAICQGDYTILAAGGANQYVWDTTATLNLLEIYNPRATPFETTTYYVTGTDVFGCTDFDSVTVIVNPVYIDTFTVGICNGDSIFVGGAYQYDPGYYVDSLATDFGCDSTVVTEVFINGPCIFPEPRGYVDKDATGANNGTSWADAFTDLQDALDAAQFYVNLNEIWIAEGDYYPSDPGGRGATFELFDSLKLYGGFLGTETMLEERPSNPLLVRLNGNVGAGLDSTDNVYHVVTIDTSCADCRLDNLSVQFGYGDGPGQDEYGAGLFIEGKIILNGLMIERNTSSMQGSAIFNHGLQAETIIKDCTFRLNHSTLDRDILNSNGASIQLQGMNILED